MRINYALFFIVFLLISCDYFPFSAKEKQGLDTVIDYTQIDQSPTFPNCIQFQNKERAQCFREELQRRIASTLHSVHFTVVEELEETVYVHLVVSNQGKVQLKGIESSSQVNDKLPALDSLVHASIQQLPYIQPATKKSFTVTTQYKLPIKISVKNSEIKEGSTASKVRQ